MEKIKQFEDNKDLRFVKVNKGSKKPFEKDWVNHPYTYDEITAHIDLNINYGVLCGYGGLIVIDADDQELREHINKFLPETFRIKTGSGGTHDYYICKDLNKKIVLQREKHYGEIQNYGSQVVAPNSIHPNGNVYEVMKDLPIIEISKDFLLPILKPFMKEIQVIENKNLEELKDYGESDINKIPIMSIISGSFKAGGRGEYYGANPWHNSSTGMNFWINPSKNLAYCFRCGAGLNVAKVIALNENIITDCNERLSKEDFFKVLDVAYEKYGLKKIEKKENIVKAFDSFTREAQAEEFCKQQPIFYDKTGMFWIWDIEDKFWKAVDDVEILNLINSLINIDVISSKSRTEILNSLKQIGRKKIPKEKNNYLIQFKNGLIHYLHPDSLLEPSPAYFITNPIPWKLGSSTETPIMDKIFEEWVGKENINLLYEIIAYCLLPDYPLHRIFCLIGAGRNGKSSYLNLIGKFLGKENITSTELDNLLNSRFEVTRLHKKLVCQMGETNFNELSKTSMLKKLCGNDLIGFEYKNKIPFEDKNYAKIIIATNNLPTTSDKTLGFYSRWILLNFPKLFDEKKDILSDIPNEEFENLATKSIFILKDLLEKREFTNEGDLQTKINNYELRSNPFERFYDGQMEEDLNSHIWSFDLERKFNQWCEENHFRKFSEHTIGKKMKERGVSKSRMWSDWLIDGQKKQLRCWVGVKWKD